MAKGKKEFVYTITLNFDEITWLKDSIQNYLVQGPVGNVLDRAIREDLFEMLDKLITE